MLRSPEISDRMRTVGSDLIGADADRDFKRIEKILTSEYLKQPGAKIADKMLDILGIPTGQWSGYDTQNFASREGRLREEALAKSLTNKAGIIYREDFLSRDPRHFLENQLDRSLLKAMNPKLAEIFQNEFEHRNAKINEGQNESVMPFVYLRMPGGVDLILKGYQHVDYWQKEHGKYLKQTAQNAQILCIEGGVEIKFGDSLKHLWEKRKCMHYAVLMRDAVGAGFKGLFAEIDTRDASKINLDNENLFGLIDIFPNLPKEFYQKYFAYLERFFPVDAIQIKNTDNLKKILMILSTTDEGLDKYEKCNNVQNIRVYASAHLDKSLIIKRNMTGLEYGMFYFSDAMAALKLHLIANEMRDGGIDKGIIVDFEGDAHLPAKFFFLRNPLYAMMTVLKSPHFILTEQLAKKDDVSTICQAFSPDEKMFKDMFKQIHRLEFARAKKIGNRTETKPGIMQMPMIKYEIPGRDKILRNRLESLNLNSILDLLTE